MKEGMSRRDFLTGSAGVVAATLAGAESAEARELTNEDIEKIRTEMREAIGASLEFFALLDANHYNPDTLKSEGKHEHLAFMTKIKTYATIARETLLGSVGTVYGDSGLNALDSVFSSDKASYVPHRVYAEARKVLTDIDDRMREAHRLFEFTKEAALAQEAAKKRLDEARKFLYALPRSKQGADIKNTP